MTQTMPSLETTADAVTQFYNDVITSDMITTDIITTDVVTTDVIINSINISNKSRNPWLVPKDYWTHAEHGATTINNSTNQGVVSWVVYLAAAILVLPGLLGNALLFCMSLRAELRSFSYSVYLLCCSVPDSICLVFIYLNLILQTYGTSIHLTFRDMPSCLLTSLLATVAARVSPWIMVVFSLDRMVMTGTTNNKYETQRAWVGPQQRIEASRTHREACDHHTEGNFGQTETSHEQGDVSREQGRQREQRQANRAQSDVTKVTQVLLTLPLFTFLALTPFAIVSSIAVVMHKGVHVYMWSILNTEVYFRMIYSISFAGNFYILMATSKPYRRVVREMVGFSTS